MNKKVWTIIFAVALLTACGGNENNSGKDTCSMPQETAEQYAEVSKLVARIEDALEESVRITNKDDILRLNKLNEQLQFQYDAAELDSASLAQCKQLKLRVNNLHERLNKVIQESVQTIHVSLESIDQELLETTREFPVYLERGDKFFYKIDMEKPADIRIYNADSRQSLKNHVGKRSVTDSIDIRFNAVYLVQVNPKTRQYATVDLSYRANSIERLASAKSVTTDTIDAQKGDFLAFSKPGIQMKNLFEEPRKFTLRGQLKAAFSGSYRAIVAIQVPSGATDVLYSLRISTNEPDSYSDGKFHDNMEISYKRIKLLGLPVYESHGGSGIISTLLGENLPKREEDAYINMYVFYNAAQAKKFQDGADPAKLAYNIDYSTMGTQSCNGRIPSKGYKTIYMGFLNERMRYNNYVWLEAVSAVPKTEYYKPQFIIK